MTVTDSLRSTLIYDTTADAAQINADIAEMQQFDRENEKQESLWGWVGFAGVAFAIISIIFLVFTGEEPGMAPLGIGGLVIGVITAIVGFVVRSRYGKFNLEDMRYLFLQEVVRLLKTDMPEGGQFKVRLSFLKHNHNDNFERKGSSGPWKVKYFKHPWVTISGQLLDGAKFTVSLVEKQQDRHKTKRSASGKTKTKYKQKNAGEALVVLRFKEKRYPAFAANQQSLIDKVQLPEGTLLKGLDVANDSIKIQAKADGSFESGEDAARARWRVRLATSMLLSCYHILNQSRRAAS